MYTIIGLFIALLFVNIYFRLKVIRAYRVLRNLNIHFDAAAVFDKARLESEIIYRHPEHRHTIVDFAHYLRQSITMAILLIVLITLFGAVLMYYRQHG